jgi:hypothetical protein
MAVNRYSSRRAPLDETFLREKLRGARRYKRIAGYFRSSILELASEELNDIDEIYVVCNSEVDFGDVAVARQARDATLKERWNRDSSPADALLHRPRYQMLHDMLTTGKLHIRVVPRSAMFLHGKAGIVESRNGEVTSFVGSANETRSGFAANYEIIWEDDSPDAITWVDEEFAALWELGVDLPDAIVDEIGRLAHRTEVSFGTVVEAEVPAAAFVESPMYLAGQVLQPWQQAFVATMLEHRARYGCTRLLLADEVGLGKTLSLGASAVVSSLLGDGPVLILCPATLTRQWQAELFDRLGAPSAVWSSTQKCWIDPHGHLIRTRGAMDVVSSPYQIAIVSTGLIVNGGAEADALLAKSYGMVILDEAHKARSARGVTSDGQPNNLLAFMLAIAERSKHVLLGTATPIQTSVGDLWDLMDVLAVKNQFVLGAVGSQWRSGWQNTHPMITGEAHPSSPADLWEWIRNPLAAGSERGDGGLAAVIRNLQDTPDDRFVVATPFRDLDPFARQELTDAGQVLRHSNPVLRHSVLRRRDTLEQRGLLERIAVDLHPRPETIYHGVPFIGRALPVNPYFDAAYKAAEEYCASIRATNPGAGFMKTLMLQRLCSSFAAGASTAQRLLDRIPLPPDEADQIDDINVQAVGMSATERAALERIISELARVGSVDPKLAAVKQFLLPRADGGQGWVNHGCIIFSQYYDTAAWIAEALSRTFADLPVGLYTNAAKSGMWQNGEFATTNRNDLKQAVQDRSLRVVVATDAACEGLNLQMLGSLINVDLPWNPSRLEQRLGRIKRFGQLRPSVDVLNLAYQGTQDERIHTVLSDRFKDIFETFGGITDALDADWIERAEELRDRVDTYISERQTHANPFEMKYTSDLDVSGDRWETCAKVFSRPDVDERLRRPW